MKPVHVVLLLLGGALGGAMIMKMAHPGRHAVPAPTVARVQSPATTPAPQAIPPAIPPPVEQPAATGAPADTPAAPKPAPPAPKPAPAPVATKPAPTPPAPKASPAPFPVAARKIAPSPVQAWHETRKPSPFEPLPPAAPRPVGDPEPVERPSVHVAQVIPPSVTSFPTSPTAVPPPVAAEPEHVTPVAPPPAPQPHQVTLNAGLLFPVRLMETLSSERNSPGDMFAATLARALVVDGLVIAERGARVEGRVIAVDRAKPGAGAALALELTRLRTSDGQEVRLETESLFRHADTRMRRDAVTEVDGLAILGALIGAIAGGGKGAAIGAGVGAGAGGGVALATRGRPLELATETPLYFRLKTAIPLTADLR